MSTINALNICNDKISNVHGRKKSVQLNIIKRQNNCVYFESLSLKFIKFYIIPIFTFQI